MSNAYAYLGVEIKIECLRNFRERLAVLTITGEHADWAEAEISTLAREHDSTCTTVWHLCSPGVIVVHLRGRDVAGVWSAVQIDRRMDTRLPAAFGAPGFIEYVDEPIERFTNSDQHDDDSRRNS